MFAGDLLAERARVSPHRIALVSVETGERVSYADLNARAARAARTLIAEGLAPGDRYAILSLNSIEFVELFFAGVKAGCTVVPLSTRATAHELTEIVRDCDVKLLFHGEEHREIAAALPIPRIHPWEFRREDGELPEFVPSAEVIDCLLYTSGTTGKPKGVMIPRRQLLWNGYNTVVNWSLREEDVSPIFTPLYHAGGFAAFLIPVLTVGGTVVIHKTFDAAEVWNVIDSERCTVVLGVPAIWKMLAESPQFVTAKLEHVRWFISGGAPLPAGVTELYEARGVPMKQGFGMTEVGVNCFTMTVEESREKRGSIGKPLLNTEVRLAGDGGREVATGEVGEMWIRGPHVSSGYWGNVVATAEAYDGEGWFHTGDLARRDDEGFFFIAGRRKEMFITGGVNVYPAEIEAALVAHPEVADAAVIAVSDPRWGEAGVAFVVTELSDAALIEFLSGRIAKYKIPQSFHRIEALPRTPYGKVVKDDLRRRIEVAEN